ncbi:MAG: polyribonucleotide nucleotidyltransferase, partial [Candidatus Gracilibacteria bacterium]
VALMLTGAPFEGPVGAVRVGYVNDQLVLNPTYKECEEGKLNLIVAGTMDAITMVEAAAKEVPEDIILQAFDMAHKEIKKICQFQLDYVKQFKVDPVTLELAEASEDVKKAIEGFVTDAMLDSIKGKTKMEIKGKIHEIKDKLVEKYAKEIKEEMFSEGELMELFNEKMEKKMRKNILEKEERIDGRKLDEVRQISVIPDVLPRVHGSCIFQRGETIALSITTLGAPGDAQILDLMDRDIVKRYMHHYHFPPYATGDIKMLRGPGRREIGHGDLAERALIPVLPTEEKFPYTVMVVSEIPRCNGSSSMASVCGSTLSLMCAGVPITKPVAGVAMGLVSNSETGDYKILTDIQGMEDFAGDMDFKSAGTKDGITALQMDIKIKGLSLDLMKNALARAKEAREFIMEKMLAVVPEARKELSKYAPLIMSIKINPDLIKVVIGKGGETIQKITKECDVQIDVTDEGLVQVTAPDQEKGEKAVEWIKKLTYVPKVGDVFDGRVTRIMDFGAFVEITPGKEGLCHISQLANERVNRVEDVVKLGDTLKVKLVEIDDMGRLNLSHKVLLDGGDTKSAGGAHHSEKGHGGKPVKGTSSVRKAG